MAKESKYITLTNNVLIEYIYDNDNLKKVDYNIINNLNINEKGYCSKYDLNNLDNQVFAIDSILKKYAKIDSNKYNFLKIGSFESQICHFDTIRIHLPTTFSFIDNNYIGLYLKIYIYDYIKKNTVNLTSFLYDDTEINADKNIILNKEFLYSEQQWGKYLTFDIPSTYDISKQRTNNISANLPLSNSLNINLSEYGISPETPIFIDFSWVISKQTILGSTYYYFSDLYTKSISNKPEYQTLGVQIKESKDGDYFEIFGTYNQTNEELDNWVNDMSIKGRKIRIEYVVSLFEENILTTQQTYIITENFAQKILYRPIITFSNTVAAIDVEMKIIDLYDNSQIIKIASIGLKENIFKYGRRLNSINISNAYKPKIYNQKVLNTNNKIYNQNIPDIKLTKVNFPVIVDRIKILTSATPSNDTEYKSMGLSEIIINPFSSIFKFNIATTNDDGIIIPYNLTKITENSTITLSFKDDTSFIEKNIWQQSNDNNFELGTIIFKIDENDLSTIKNISKNNKNYYITIKNDNVGMRTLLYSGKFVFYNDLTFLNSNTTIDDTNYNDFIDTNIDNTKLKDILNNNNNIYSSDTNKNLFIFLKHDANVSEFENFLSQINADIHFKQAGGNNITLTYMYFILNVNKQTIIEIKNRNEVMTIKEIDFCIGKGKTDNIININSIKKSITDFNCISHSIIKLKKPTNL